MASAEKSKNEEDKKKKSKETITSTKTPTKKTPNPEKEKKKKSKKKKPDDTSNGTRSQSPDVWIIPSSGGDEEVQEETEKKHAKRKQPKSGNSNSPKTQKGKKRKERDEDDDKEEEGGAMCRFPMARIKRIIKSEDPSLQLSQHVVFLINKATEKFIEQFSEEAYECSVRDRKKSLGYKHLSSVVSEQRRFDFLSEFVPEKLKAQDALAQRKLVETKQ